jgi:hypothetical protein
MIGSHRPAQPVGRVDRVGLPAPDPQQDVGDHHRQPDGHHGLAQFLALHAPENLVLQQQAERADHDEHDRKGQQPRPGSLRDLKPDIATQQIQRAMRQIDVAHQPEDQREA